MTKHLDDMEIASFVDGVSDNKNKVIEHLNECAYCFEITTATMQSVETEKETCKQLDNSFHQLINL
jgi:hypothetical protein